MSFLPYQRNYLKILMHPIGHILKRVNQKACMYSRILMDQSIFCLIVLNKQTFFAIGGTYYHRPFHIFQFPTCLSPICHQS